MTGEFRGAGRSHRRTEQESDIEVAPPTFRDQDGNGLEIVR
jgi:hypothetical protein